MATIIHPLEQEPADIFQMFCTKPYTLFLDSADTRHPDAACSYVLISPAEIIETKNSAAVITSRHGQTEQTGNPFDILQEQLDHYKTIAGPAQPHLPPFQGGAAGLFSYDLGRTLEKLPASAKEDRDMPDMAVGIYTQIYAYDHRKKQGWLITHEDSLDRARTRQAWFLQFIEDRHKPRPHAAGNDINWTPAFTKDRYLAAIRRTIEYIHAGDIFQANLAQSFEAELPETFDPAAHYMTLRESNPAPFAAYFNLGDIKIASASPERFLNVRDGHVTTKPIKGTRPRSADPDTDKKNADALLKSAKDRAENIMIVDLLRNDLSRTCKPDSVEVEKLCALESFSSVHHLVSTITEELQDGKTPVDLLKTCFPGGSVTGAPKIRAMEIIEEQENLRRGPYCGSLGYIGFDGGLDTNILIRTLIYKGGKVSLSAGGGIVADSSPESEYQETLDKAEAMFKSFSATPKKSIKAA